MPYFCQKFDGNNKKRHTYMKRIYLIPQIRIQAIDTEDIMEGSLPIFNGDNPRTDAENDVITNKSEILGNSNSVWDEEEE